MKEDVPTSQSSFVFGVDQTGRCNRWGGPLTSEQLQEAAARDKVSFLKPLIEPTRYDTSSEQES